MHSYNHEESGVAIHHNGDYSGDALVHLPANTKVELRTASDGMQYWEIEIPCAPLAQFSRWATLSEVTQMLEGLQ